MSVACGASKEADINRRMLIQPPARMPFQRAPARRANARCARRLPEALSCTDIAQGSIERRRPPPLGVAPPHEKTRSSWHPASWLLVCCLSWPAALPRRRRRSIRARSIRQHRRQHPRRPGRRRGLAPERPQAAPRGSPCPPAPPNPPPSATARRRRPVGAEVGHPAKTVTSPPPLVGAETGRRQEPGPGQHRQPEEPGEASAIPGGLRVTFGPWPRRS